MEKLEESLLNSLKSKLLEVNNTITNSSTYFGSYNPKLDLHEKIHNYYLKKIKNNLYLNIHPKYKLGRGANAVRSSAAMIYNTIGTGTIIINKTDYVLFQYEDNKEKLPGIKGRRGPTLDVTLVDKRNNDRLFIEAKCLEWLSKSEKLKNQYLQPENYYYSEAADIFIPFFKKIILNSELPKEEYSSIYERYNSKQMTIHILGIYNWCKKNSRNLPKRISLMNIVWDYDEAEEYRTEEKEGLEYVASANKTFKKLFKDLGIDFSVEYVKYSDFLNQVDWSKDTERRKYLKRYEI